MESNTKVKLLATTFVALMMFCSMAVMVSNDDGLDAAVGDGGTYTYTLVYDQNEMTNTAAQELQLTVAGMTPISHAANTTTLTSVANEGSWAFNQNTGVGPFNSFYGAFDATDGNKFVAVMNPYDLTETISGDSLPNNGHYNIMWILPTVYWKVDNGNLILTNDSTAGGTAYAHTIDGHTYRYLAIGVYEGASYEDSTSGKTYLTSESGQTITAMPRITLRGYAHNYTMDSSLNVDQNNPAHSMLWNFYMWELYKYCSLTVMEGFNSQNIVGNGVTGVGTAYFVSSGLGDSLGPYAGNPGVVTESGTNQSDYAASVVKLFLENAWGNYQESLDGIIVNGTSGYALDTRSTPDDTNLNSPYVTSITATLPPSYRYSNNIYTDAEIWGMPGLGEGTYLASLTDVSMSSSNSGCGMFVGGTTTFNPGWSLFSGINRVDTNLSYNDNNSYTTSRLAFVFDANVTASQVSFDTNNAYGTLQNASTIDVENGAVITISGNTLTIGSTTVTANPLQDTDEFDYSFDGWYDGLTQLQNGDTVSGNMTITAHFSRTTNAYNVSLVAGTGGTVTTDTIASVPYGTAVTVSGNTLTFATTPNATVITATPSSTAQYTYSFSEWQKNGVTLSADTTTGTNDVYTAVFSSVLNTYTVTIQSNDITLGTVSPTSVASVPYGTQIAVSGDTLTINGTTVTASPSAATPEHEYSFASWSIQNNYVVEGNVTITATFVEGAAEYTVTIQANDDTYGTVSPTSIANVPYGTSITVSGNTLSINGTTVTATPANANQQYTYGFGSWSVSDNDTVTEATTITATFTATLKTYTITWSINGETETETYEYGQTPTHATPVRAYYDFAGWDPAIATVTGDRTYTATWTPTVYTVTFDGQEGTPAVASATGSVETAVTLPDCTRSEWYFAGWYDSNDTLIGYAGTPYYPTADITLYAEWSDQVIRHYSLVYNANGGDGAPESQFYQSTDPEVSSWTFTISSTVPTSALGDFLGWALTQNANEAEYQPGDEITVEADTAVTLYAVWEESAGHSVLKSILEIVPYLIVIGIILALTATIFMNRMRGDGISELTPVIIQAALAILVVVIILIPFLGMI